MQQYGYVRVSSREQNDQRQRTALRAFGIPERNIYAEKRSGRDFSRPVWQSLAHGRLQAGDLLVVQSIDRMGRNYDEILAEWRHVIKEVGAHIVVLDMPLLDTRPERDLTGTLIADIVLQLLSYVAQTEREMIRQRQAEGIAAARALGRHLGRPPTPVPEGFGPIYERWRSGSLSAREAAALCGLGPDAFRRMRRKYESRPPR